MQRKFPGSLFRTSYQFLGPQQNRAQGPSFKQITAPYSQKVDKNVYIGGPSMQAFLLGLVKQSPQFANNITFIGKKSWLCNVHDDWDDKPWGQNKRYLPKPLRDISNRLFPNYPENDLLNFGIAKSIVRELTSELASYGITQIDEYVDSIYEKKDGSLVAKFNGVESLISETPNYHIVNAALDIISPPKFLIRNCGEIYWEPIVNSVEPLVVVGSGANLTWTCRDVSSLRKIIHLIPTNDRIRSDLRSNLSSSFHMDNCNIESTDEYLEIEGIDAITNTNLLVRVKRSQVFSAMGYEHNSNLVNVDSRKLTDIDGTPKPESIVTTQRFAFGNPASRTAIDYRGSVVPNGNMALNYLKIQLGSDRYVANESNAILLYDAWKDVVTQAAIANRITISEDFFDIVEPRVKHIYTNSVPSEEQVYTVLELAYKKSGPTINSDGKELSWSEFAKFIHDPTDELIEDIHADSENKNTPTI